MRLATATDFHGSLYTDYRHHDGYAKRARLLSAFPQPMLIVGCGFGFTVAELRKLGLAAWGIDASPYAFANRATSFMVQNDILQPAFSGILNTQFGTVITEDLLPCLTDDEARLAAFNCATLGPLVVHMVTEQGEADLNYHATGYWMSLTNQLAVSLEGM